MFKRQKPSSPSTSSDEIICSICLDKLDTTKNNICKTKCGHSFHLDCLMKQKGNNCPLCRTEVCESRHSTQDNPNHNGQIILSRNEIFEISNEIHEQTDYDDFVSEILQAIISEHSNNPAHNNILKTTLKNHITTTHHLFVRFLNLRLRQSNDDIAELASLLHDQLDQELNGMEIPPPPPVPHPLSPTTNPMPELSIVGSFLL